MKHILAEFYEIIEQLEESTHQNIESCPELINRLPNISDDIQNLIIKIETLLSQMSTEHSDEVHLVTLKSIPKILNSLFNDLTSFKPKYNAKEKILYCITTLIQRTKWIEEKFGKQPIGGKRRPVNGHVRRLIQKIEELERKRNKLRKKLSGLEDDKLHETRRGERDRLQHIIDGIENERQQVEQQLTSLENQLPPEFRKGLSIDQDDEKVQELDTTGPIKDIDPKVTRIDDYRKRHPEKRIPEMEPIPIDSIQKTTLKEEKEAVKDPEYDYTQEEWYSPQSPKMKNEKFEQFQKNFHTDVLLMTATECELLQVLRLLKPPPPKRKIRRIQKGYQTYYIGKFGEFLAVVVKSEMGSGGPSGSSATASDAITSWKPKALISSGIAFGADRDKYQPADVLIADKIVPYEKQRKGENAIFRSEIPRVGLTLLNRFKNVSGWSFKRPDRTKVKCYSGAILSGEKLIDDPEYKRELIEEFPEAIGGEMEGVGIYEAAYRANLEWILVKGMSDWADGKKHDNYQEMAAAAAASLAHFVLSNPNTLDGL